MKIRRYSELKALASYEDRFQYLRLYGKVGHDTFAYDRYLNQTLYHLKEWQSARRDVIVRDNGCDMGMPGYEIHDRIIVHHMNPITAKMILDRDPRVFDPENLITVSFQTHNLIHYGVEKVRDKKPVIRTRNDTCPWK